MHLRMKPYIGSQTVYIQISYRKLKAIARILGPCVNVKKPNNQTKTYRMLETWKHISILKNVS